MFNNKTKNAIIKNKSDWLTIPEAVYLANQKKNRETINRQRHLSPCAIWKHLFIYILSISNYIKESHKN